MLLIHVYTYILRRLIVQSAQQVRSRDIDYYSVPSMYHQYRFMIYISRDCDVVTAYSSTVTRTTRSEVLFDNKAEAGYPLEQ